MAKFITPVILNDVVNDNENSLFQALSVIPNIKFHKTLVEGYSEVCLEGKYFPYFKNGGMLHCHAIELDPEYYKEMITLIENYYAYNLLNITYSFSSISEASVNDKFGLVQLYPCTDHYRALHS